MQKELSFDDVEGSFKKKKIVYHIMQLVVADRLLINVDSPLFFIFPIGSRFRMIPRKAWN